MANHIVGLEGVCDKICEKLALLGANDPPSLTLTERSADGRLCTFPVTEELIETYIEQDFGGIPAVSSTTHAPHGFTVKLIHSHRKDGWVLERVLHLPYPGAIFRRLVPYIRMPTVFIHILGAGIATYVDSIPSLPHNVKETDDENIGFILQSIPGGDWPANFGACFTYNFKRRCMYIFLCTYSTDKSFSDNIDISSFGTSEQSPFMLPSVITRLNLDARTESLDKTQSEIYQLECALGVRRDRDTHVDILSIDYSVLSRTINALNADLSWTMHSCKQTKRLLEFMDTVATNYKTKALAHNYSLEETDRVKQDLLSSHLYLRSWNQGLIDRVEYLTSRLQASSQSVYSGIAQRDSASSISIGITSTKLAETSQQVAIATSRDSAVMRVITSVTVVFLPGTFTATFFSTTFFNFGDGINGRVYSKWLWLYFVVTVALTAVVIGGTWVLWKSKEKEITRQGDEAAAVSKTERLKSA